MYERLNPKRFMNQKLGTLQNKKNYQKLFNIYSELI